MMSAMCGSTLPVSCCAAIASTSPVNQQTLVGSSELGRIIGGSLIGTRKTIVPDGATIRLLGDQTRRAACQLVMAAPEGWFVAIDRPRRSLRQSSRFWATCDDVARSGAIWSGTTHTKDDWHTLFLAGWSVIKERPTRMLIGLENELVSLIPHSRNLSESEMGELLDYQTAWCAMHGVALRE